jgi:hypothetical protein
VKRDHGFILDDKDAQRFAAWPSGRRQASCRGLASDAATAASGTTIV